MVRARLPNSWLTSNRCLKVNSQQWHGSRSCCVACCSGEHMLLSGRWQGQAAPQAAEMHIVVPPQGPGHAMRPAPGHRQHSAPLQRHQDCTCPERQVISPRSKLLPKLYRLQIWGNLFKCAPLLLCYKPFLLRCPYAQSLRDLRVLTFGGGKVPQPHWFGRSCRSFVLGCSPRDFLKDKSTWNCCTFM